MKVFVLPIRVLCLRFDGVSLARQEVFVNRFRVTVCKVRTVVRKSQFLGVGFGDFVQKLSHSQSSLKVKCFREVRSALQPQGLQRFRKIILHIECKNRVSLY